MTTHKLSGIASLLDERIDILEKSVIGPPTPVKEVFRTISGILILVRVSPLVSRPFFNFLVSLMSLPGQDDYQ